MSTLACEQCTRGTVREDHIVSEKGAGRGGECMNEESVATAQVSIRVEHFVVG